MDIAIIPARAGSKGIPNKNLQKIGNKSLVQIAIDAAKESEIFDDIILSTDIPDLLKDSPEGVTVIKRPNVYAGDHALMSEVLNHAIDTYRPRLPLSTIVWVLQPTTPFRAKEHFDHVKKVISSGSYRSVISVKHVSGYHPNRMYTKKHSILKPIRYNSFENRQGLMDMYIRNGAFYAFSLAHFYGENTFYHNPCYAYVMDEYDSINIDSPIDLELARLVHQKRKKK